MALQPVTLGHALYGTGRDHAKMVMITNYTGLSKEDLRALVECKEAAGHPPRLQHREIGRLRGMELIDASLQLTSKGERLYHLVEQMVHEVWHPPLPLVLVPPPYVPQRLFRKVGWSKRELGTLFLVAANPGMARDAIVVSGRDPYIGGPRAVRRQPPRCLARLLERGLLTIQTEGIERVYLTSRGTQLVQEIERRVREEPVCVWSN